MAYEKAQKIIAEKMETMRPILKQAQEKAVPILYGMMVNKYNEVKKEKENEMIRQSALPPPYPVPTPKAPIDVHIDHMPGDRGYMPPMTDPLMQRMGPPCAGFTGTTRQVPASCPGGYYPPGCGR